MMMMKMYFHFRIQEPILFREWLPKDITGYVASCIVVALIAGLYEIIKCVRSRVEKKVNEQSVRHIIRLLFLLSNLKRGPHVISSSIYFVEMFIAYSLMMISMTYNVPIFLSLVIGHMVAFFFLIPLMSVQEYEKIEGCCK
uniref:Copper transport protein n=1 Tax=Angiostrongylus cantonensis TaxID=6313 RepID=A0A0K0CUJ0_ANGCA